MNCCAAKKPQNSGEEGGKQRSRMISSKGTVEFRASGEKRQKANTPLASIAAVITHRITEWLRLKGTSAGHLVQPPCPSMATQSQLPRSTSRQLLTLSKDGKSTTSGVNLLQCSVTLREKKCFLMFRGNILCLSLCPVPLVLSLGSTRESLAPFSLHLPFRYWWDPPWDFSLLNSPSSLISLPPHEKCFSPLITVVVALWTLSSMSMSLLYWGVQNQMQYSKCGLTNVEQSGRITSLDWLHSS